MSRVTKRLGYDESHRTDAVELGGLSRFRRTAGEAIPWPRPGDQQAEPQQAAGDAVVEGDATEVFEEDEKPKDHSARRDRAKKRKRKQRR